MPQSPQQLHMPCFHPPASAIVTISEMMDIWSAIVRCALCVFSVGAGPKGGGRGHRYSMLQPVQIFKENTWKCEISLGQDTPWFFIFDEGQIKQQHYNSFFVVWWPIFIVMSHLKVFFFSFLCLVVLAASFAKLLNFLTVLHLAMAWMHCNDAED